MSRQRFAVLIILLVLLVITTVVAIRYFANPLAAPTRPTVNIRGPASNARVPAGADIKVEAVAEGGIIQRTELHLARTPPTL